MTCGILWIYIYDILFNPNENSKIQDKKRLNKRTIETVLNELFVLDDQDTNEATIQQYANENNVFFTVIDSSFVTASCFYCTRNNRKLPTKEVSHRIKNKYSFGNIFKYCILTYKFHFTKKQSSFPISHWWIKYVTAKYLSTSS